MSGANIFIRSSVTKSFILCSRNRRTWNISTGTRHLSTMVHQHIQSVVTHEEFIRSAQDKRYYKGLELTNGMKVLLVSDPETDKSSAAMAVHIGCMKDPVEIPGLAHFCEHMLFLGTEKYPEENDYSKFLNEHGGSSNAFTSGEHTNFYFDVSPEHLAATLDRFSQFFLCPLFNASATEREVNAVNSENDKNLQADQWRVHQLEKSLADPKHDYHKFGTGNKYTLETRTKEMGLDVRDELLKFHKQYYSSNLMGLTVLGKESVDELAEMIVPMFSGVENKNQKIPEWSEPPYGPDQTQIVCYVAPVKDLRNLSLTWSIPDLLPYYASNPGHYLGHLIGHEGPGSLLSELKSRGWVNTLVGGQKGGAKGFMFFMVNVDLTEEGLEHVDDIITLVYQYMNMLRKVGVQQWVFQECQDLSNMTFRFKDKEKPRNYTQSCSGILFDYPMKEVLGGPYLLLEYRPDLIDMILDLLKPENMRVVVIAKKFEGQTDCKEKYYGTEYKLEDISAEKLEQWRNCGLHDNLKLPERNEFIPTNFDLVPKQPEQSSLPEMIRDSTMTRLWFRQDDKFLLPKACITFELNSPLAYIDPVYACMITLFVSLFKDALNEYSYAAEVAGLHYSLDSTVYGVYLTMRGYNDKQPVLLRKILEKMTSFKIDPKRYEILKEMFDRGLKNFSAEQPHQHAIYYTNVLMSEVLWTKDELLEALDDVTLEKLQAFVPQLFSKLYMEGLIFGNVTKESALETTDMMETILREHIGSKPLQTSQQKRYRELQLPDDHYYVYKKTNDVHKSSSLEIYYQCGMQNTRANMLLELFTQVIGEPCFNILRTQEQLGYIVFSGIRRSSGVHGLRIIVQSDRTPEYVESRIEAFLHSMDDCIKNMSDEEYQKHILALATKRMEQPKKLTGQNLKYWSEISSRQYNFDRDNVEVAFLKTVKKDDLYQFFKDLICNDAPRRHKLTVHVMSTVKEEGASQVEPEQAISSSSDEAPSTAATDGLSSAPVSKEPVIIENVAAFKRDLALYPLAKPYIDLLKGRSKL